MRRAVRIQLWRARRDVFSRRSAAKPAGWVRPDRICWSEPAIACSRRASPLSRQPPLIGRSCEGRTKIHRFDQKISLRANRSAGIRRVSPKTYATPALTMRAAANAGGNVAFSCGLRPSSHFFAFVWFFYHTGLVGRHTSTVPIPVTPYSCRVFLTCLAEELPGCRRSETFRFAAPSRRASTECACSNPT